MKEFYKNQIKIFLVILPLYLAIVLSSIIKVNCYLYLPGNLTDISNEIIVNDQEKSLNGSVSSVYVMDLTKPNLLTLAISSLHPYTEIYWVSKEHMANHDDKLEKAIGSYDSYSSFTAAILSAYETKNLPFDYRQVTYIYSANKEIISDMGYTSLVGKVVKKIDGLEKEYPSLKEISDVLSLVEKGKDIKLILIDKKSNEKEATLTKNEKGIFGLSFKTSFEITSLKTDEIKIKNVYTLGPSGGAMQALYIYLALNSSNDILKGRKIAGTGTIDFELDSEGNLKTFSKIGPIGAVSQKLYAAKIDGASIFYCPEENYVECMRAYSLYGFKETDIKVVKVSYLKDIIFDLEN